MNLVTIAWKSIRQRALASGLTALSVALGVALMVAVLVMDRVVTDHFNQSASGYDLVIGSKGSALQLVLNTVFFMDRPIEPMPYLYYRDQLKKVRAFTHLVPITLGDTTADGRFRTVGTTPEYFALDYIPGRQFVFRDGSTLVKPFDAVVGARVAREYGWRVGSQFPIAHSGNVQDIHDELFTVSGVLRPTGTPNDRVVFLNIDGFYAMSEHTTPQSDIEERERTQRDERATVGGSAPVPTAVDPRRAHDPDAAKKITAVLAQTKDTFAAAMLKAKINRTSSVAQAVNPIEEIRKLLVNLVGNVRTVLLLLTLLIIVVSVISILVSIYNTMSERKREIAIMRALGARRWMVLSIVVAEALLLCICGGAMGLLLGHGLVFIASPIVEARADLLIDPWSFDLREMLIAPVLLLLAALAGLVPGLTAYETDVVRGLQD